MSHGGFGDIYTTELSLACGTGGSYCNSSALSSSHGMARQYRLLGSPTVPDVDSLQRRRPARAAAYPTTAAAAAAATAHAHIVDGSRPTEEEEEERDPR